MSGKWFTQRLRGRHRIGMSRGAFDVCTFRGRLGITSFGITQGINDRRRVQFVPLMLGVGRHASAVFV